MVRITQFKLLLFASAMCLTGACKEEKKTGNTRKKSLPDYEIKNDGQRIVFNNWGKMFAFEACRYGPLSNGFEATATAVAVVLPARSTTTNKMILFEQPMLNQLYTGLLQSESHVNRDRVFLDRTKDMYQHQSATGIELKDAETGYSDAQNELMEKEASLRMEGFDPTELRSSAPGVAWVFAQIPEGNIAGIKKRMKCEVSFTSLSNKILKGKVIAIGEVLNIETRTLKVRIQVENPENLVRPGMYGSVMFPSAGVNSLSIPTKARITVQGNDYVFLKKGNGVERVTIHVESEGAGRIAIQSGIQKGDTVVSEGSILLKGLSFGY